MPVIKLSKNKTFLIFTYIGLVFLLIAILFSPAAEISPANQTSTIVIDSTEYAKGTIEALIKRKLAEGKTPNRLIKEKSPYLLQHAFNPVNWYSWGDEAFKKARDEDKPIFLSVGYSTCYWCHVMEREVFENDSIAALLNEYVVSIKVDREERPDVDRVYMTALSGMTGSGGWPMSMFLTPDLKPFFGATYIPPTAKYGRASFPDILNHIHEVWTTDRGKILQTSQQLGEYLQQASAPETKLIKAGTLALKMGFDSFSKSYDKERAGFGGAPKFPRPVAFNFLFRYYKRTGEKRALDMSLETLKHMKNGGMYDHIGGGFHRYSTDVAWHVPHFEKMMYDQAQLTVSYLEAYQITHDSFYADVARDILQYVLREMTHPDGGFYSAQDAESAINAAKPDEKHEGAFYTWSQEDLMPILNTEEKNVFDYCFDVRERGNVAQAQEEFYNLNILHVVHSPPEAAKKFHAGEREISTRLASARAKLFQARLKRPKPHLDDKVLTSWNGLMISAYARAYQVLGDEEYLRVAEQASSFIMLKVYDPKTKTLLHRYREGEARYEAGLEDYAFFIQGLVDLYEASFDIRWLNAALELSERQNALLYDTTNGGFYDITGSDKTVLIRTKESYDGAEPTGNSIAILNLLRLSQMTSNERYRDMADRSLEYFGEKLQTMPHGLPQFLVALDFSLSKPKQIIIAGKVRDRHTQEILKELHSRFIPDKILLLADGNDGQRVLASYVPFIGSIKMIGGKSTAYICENYACELPTSDVAVVAELLDGKNEGKR